MICVAAICSARETKLSCKIERHGYIALNSQQLEVFRYLQLEVHYHWYYLKNRAAPNISWVLFYQ